MLIFKLTLITLLSGSQLTDGSEDEGCEVFHCGSCPNDPSVCEQCSSEFRLIKDTGKCEICWGVNCLQCNDTASSCTLCKPEYPVIVEGRCQKCLDVSCERCPDAKDECTQCKPQYRKDNNGSCERCEVFGCKLCNADRAVCEECDEGHQSVQNNKCKECKITGCAKCDGDVWECDECFSWIESCKQNPQIKKEEEAKGCKSLGCVACTGGFTDCGSCDTQYYLEDAFCKDCMDIHSACETCVSGHECTSCMSGTGLFYNTATSKMECRDCTQNDCLKCDHEPEICQRCKPGFFLSEDGKCQACKNGGCLKCETSRTACDECQSGFRKNIDSEGRISCELCAEVGCECSKNVTQCEVCMEGWGPNDDGICKSCDDFYCLQCPAHYNRCTACKPEFPNECSLIGENNCEVKNCKVCDAAGRCEICFPGYLVYQFNCYKCRSLIPNSLDCTKTPDGYICTKCDPQFFILNGECKRECKKTLPNCMYCETTNNEKCAECQAGHTLNENEGVCS